MKIINYVNGLSHSNELQAINQILSNAQGSITFSGKRVISVSGYENCISLDKIALKILIVGDKRSEAGDFTAEEKSAGIEITRKLRLFYTTTDAELTTKNNLTKFLNMVREFTIYPYTTRFHVEYGFMKGYFEEKDLVHSTVYNFWNGSKTVKIE